MQGPIQKLGCPAQHQYQGKGCRAQSARGDARPNKNHQPLTKERGAGPNPQAGMHGPTPIPRRGGQGPIRISWLMHGPTRITNHLPRKGVHAQSEARMHGPTQYQREGECPGYKLGCCTTQWRKYLCVVNDSKVLWEIVAPVTNPTSHKVVDQG